MYYISIFNEIYFESHNSKSFFDFLLVLVYNSFVFDSGGGRSLP